VLVTNGCDTKQYRSTGPGTAWIAAERHAFARVAVFAGNINGRLDFELVEEAAAPNDATLLVFAGPVDDLVTEDLERWQHILSLKNVRHVGSMTPPELAALYRSSDLGFIPYKRERFIVRNGFPLKTLEMAATGLPVVSTLMEPIVGLASAIEVAEDAERFLESFSSVSRATLTEEEQLELLEVAEANDYDRKFEQIVAYLVGSLPADRTIRTRLDDLLLELGYEPWLASCTRIFSRFTAPAAVLTFASLYGELAAILPSWVRRLVPRWLKHQVHGHRIE
jgi:hypothetical protein